MDIIGRMTADATRKTLADGREVVNFTIAINDQYKHKGSATVKKTSTFIDCSYWIHPGLATHLTKGSLVELSGSIGVRAYINQAGEARARITCHVNAIKLHGGGKKIEDIPASAIDNGTSADNLPF